MPGLGHVRLFLVWCRATIRLIKSLACPWVEQFSEHFDAGAGGFGGFFDADDFDFFTDFDDAALYSAGYDGAASGDGEYVFYRHQEGAVYGTFRVGMKVQCICQCQMAVSPSSPASPSRASFGALMIGNVIAREFVADNSSRTSIFDEFQMVSSTMSHLFKNTMMWRHLPDGRAGCVRGSAASDRLLRIRRGMALSIQLRR